MGHISVLGTFKEHLRGMYMRYQTFAFALYPEAYKVPSAQKPAIPQAKLVLFRTLS